MLTEGTEGPNGKLGGNPEKEPARKIRPNRRSVTGLYLTRTGEKMYFESQLERDTYLILDFEPSVRNLSSQPMLVQNWYPDALVSTKESEIVVDIKYGSDIVANWPDLSIRFAALEKQCEAQGYAYGVTTESQVYWPENHRVGMLKWIEHIGRTCGDDIAINLGRRISEVIEADGPATVLEIARRVASKPDLNSTISGVSSLLVNGTKFGVSTPSNNLLDCKLFLSESQQEPLFSSRVIACEDLREWVRTYPNGTIRRLN